MTDRRVFLRARVWRAAPGLWAWNVPGLGAGFADSHPEALLEALDGVAVVSRAREARQGSGGPHGAGWRPWRRRRSARSTGGGCERGG